MLGSNGSSDFCMKDIEIWKSNRHQRQQTQSDDNSSHGQ
jgi:hypothetical protein